MAPSARGLGRRPATAGDQPGLRGVGTHTPEDAQYVFQKFPPNLVVLKSPPRPSGLARCPHSYTLASIPRPLEKPPGLGRHGPGSVSKPSRRARLSGCSPLPHPQQQRRKFSPATAAPAAAALKVYFRHAAAPSSLAPQPPASPGSPARVQAFPAQIHSRVRPKPRLPRRKVIQTFGGGISPIQGPQA